MVREDATICYVGANRRDSRFIAAEQPPHLKAIAPWEGVGDFYREHICRGGIPDPMFIKLLSKTFDGKNQAEDVATMIRKYPLMNSYWEDKNPKLHNIVVPMYVLASYSTSLHTEGSIRGWKYSNSKEKW
jgi:predicted acyl esterase